MVGGSICAYLFVFVCVCMCMFVTVGKCVHVKGCEISMYALINRNANANCYRVVG
jgi:hypothetical protein